MINIEEAKAEFLKHVQEMQIEDARIKGKVDHTLRVVNIIEKLAVQLQLEQNEVQLAQLIGLLHDIGRFEQYRKFNKNATSKTLDNYKKFNHGEAGVKVLKENQYIRSYIKEKDYDYIIYKAIYEHNKYAISENMTDKEKLFCKLIRDADKLDIIYEAIDIFWKEPKKIELIENGKLSEKMKYDFFSKKLANNINKISEADQILRFASFIFDMNFTCSLHMLKESNNLNRMIDRFEYKNLETKEDMKKIKQFANEYLKEITK